MADKIEIYAFRITLILIFLGFLFSLFALCLLDERTPSFILSFFIDYFFYRT